MTYFVLIAALVTGLALPAAPADFHAGMRAYQRGDHTTALREFRGLAEQGHAEAQYRLGLLYDYGRGVPRDHVKAVKWFRRGAKQGHAEAQYQLGVMYCMGYGVSQNHERAYVWFRLAASQLAGDERKRAAVARAFAASQLTPEQLVRAQKRARMDGDAGAPVSPRLRVGRRFGQR